MVNVFLNPFYIWSESPKSMFSKQYHRLCHWVHWWASVSWKTSPLSPLRISCKPLTSILTNWMRICRRPECHLFCFLAGSNCKTLHIFRGKNVQRHSSELVKCSKYNLTWKMGFTVWKNLKTSSVVKRTLVLGNQRTWFS